MSELTTGQLIKLILGILVFVAVVVGAYFVFKNKIIDFFQNIVAEEPVKMFLYYLK